MEVISSPTRFFAARCSVQNDKTVEIVSKELCALFRQKRLVATRNENCPDRLYLAYCLFGQLSERQQMAAFHEKITKKASGRMFGSHKQCRPCKPSSVLRRNGASIIYLQLRSLAASSNLPLDIGRATLNCRYTWSCNPRGVRPRSIATLAVGSYPAFSPLPPRREAVILCYATTPSRTSSR